jgi:hypothetical protein
MSPTFSGFKVMRSKESARRIPKAGLCNSHLLLGLFLDPEDGDNIFIRKVS